MFQGHRLPKFDYFIGHGARTFYREADYLTGDGRSAGDGFFGAAVLYECAHDCRRIYAVVPIKAPVFQRHDYRGHSPPHLFVGDGQGPFLSRGEAAAQRDSLSVRHYRRYGPTAYGAVGKGGDYQRHSRRQNEQRSEAAALFDFF